MSTPPPPSHPTPRRKASSPRWSGECSWWPWPGLRTSACSGSRGSTSRTETRPLTSQCGSSRPSSLSESTSRPAPEHKRGRENTYLMSLPLVSVRHHGRANSVKGEMKIHLECKLHFPSAQLMLWQMHLTNVSESIEAKYWVSSFDV